MPNTNDGSNRFRLSEFIPLLPFIEQRPMYDNIAAGDPGIGNTQAPQKHSGTAATAKQAGE